MNLGIILIVHGRPGDAQDHLRRALELNPPEVASVAGIHLDLGQALRQKGQLNEAIEEFRTSINLWPEFRAYSALASTLHQQGNVRDSIANYRKAIELAPQSPVAMANTAWILATASDASLRNGSQALELALRADTLSGGVDPFAIRALAAAYAETGNYSKAIETVRRGLVFATQRQLPDLASQLRSDVAMYEINLPVREAVK